MKLRNQVVLIRGRHRLSDHITIGEFARIDVDKIVLITALRHPCCLPEYDPNQILERAIEIADVLWQHELSQSVLSEYALMLNDRDVQAIEGTALDLPWLYNAIRSIHKTRKQIVIEVNIKDHDGLAIGMYINDVYHPWKEGITILQQNPSSG